MTAQEHQKRHRELHQKLDELLGDFLSHTKALPSQTPILELMQWSNQQASAPDHEPKETKPS